MSRLCVVLAALGLLALGGMSSFAPNEVWAQEETTIHITWPNEGETLYAGPSSLQYSAPIRGYIEPAGAKLMPATMRLEIVRDGQQIGSLLQPLESDTFEFLVTVNSQGSKEYFPAEHAACADDCHRPGRLGLVTGELTLRLTLLTANDEAWATAERHIVVDQASYATIPATLFKMAPALFLPALP